MSPLRYSQAAAVSVAHPRYSTTLALTTPSTSLSASAGPTQVKKRPCGSRLAATSALLSLKPRPYLPSTQEAQEVSSRSGGSRERRRLDLVQYRQRPSGSCSSARKSSAFSIVPSRPSRASGVSSPSACSTKVVANGELSVTGSASRRGSAESSVLNSPVGSWARLRNSAPRREAWTQALTRADVDRCPRKPPT